MDELIPESEYYYSNRMGRMFLIAMQDVMGEDRLGTLLEKTDLEQYKGQFPPDNLEREFNFSYVANLNMALEDMYGPRGSRGLAQRGGRALFARGLRQFGGLAGVGDLAFKVLKMETKLRIGIPAIARIFSQFSDQTSHVEEADDCFYYYIDRCSMCWGRTGTRPMGHTAIGILQEALRWVSGGLEFRVEEIECICTGAPRGVFRIDKEPLR